MIHKYNDFLNLNLTCKHILIHCILSEYLDSEIKSYSYFLQNNMDSDINKKIWKELIIIESGLKVLKVYCIIPLLENIMFKFL